ncbi:MULTISPECIES: acyltransferase [Streptomyces]|uniref:acyltransferase family protein n=1 Tax=Streptomyces TaxID=1883 RepID=UPI0011643C7A|nr:MULTISPECIES: acyltransferase [Streptomyces]MCX4609584.1 acyltransferase [Streptomyces mirabilis]NMI58917.1 acyltransferase [Streptomyces sp. RLA2-12]QDN58213.1 acyltransferase [Streptomyces sp. S1D4-20]QDN68307.1 acyltransferase [Streptomyces sp. S1D4-14]QDO50724.1 acyltransferase [Streptomyces sp. RLB3-5]
MASSAHALAEATPASRDKYVDLLRVASLGTVVLGHWLMAAVSVRGDGRAEVGNLLAVEPRLQLLTWALQVMPVFFFVGGFSHALSYRSLRRKAGENGENGEDGKNGGAALYSVFLRARLQRLLRPTVVFIGVWGALALALQLAGKEGGLLDVSLRLVAQPLWFIGIYLAMVAFTPPLLRLHDRYGWGAFGGLAAAAGLVDVLRFGFGVPYVEFLNFAFVWLAVHQLGFLRADGKLRRPYLLAGAGLAGAVLLVAYGPYPLSMVGMPGEKISNMAPPTFALLCHGLWLVGGVESLRGPARRWLRRPRVWRAVVAANGVSMTAFLWHLTAMLGVYGALLALGVRLPEPATGVWWAQVPVRVVVAGAVTALLVTVFRRFEQPSAVVLGESGVSPAGARPAAALGVTLCLFGVLGLSMVGFGGLLEGRTAVLVAVRVTAPVAVAMTLAGWLLVERAGRGRSLAA